MAEFKLGRIRFVWKGEWSAGTTYVKDDVIKYGGKTYVCSIGHTSDPSFYTDLDFVPTKWNQMTDGQDWKGDWSTGTFYALNDVVKYGGLVYICNEAHTSSATTALGLEADQAKWDVFAEGFDWLGDWTTNTRYKRNDLVKYGGITYVCNTAHTSAATTTLGLENDQSNWDSFNEGIEFKGDWDSGSVRYKVNDVVKAGANLYICTTAHTSSGTLASQISNWTFFVKGFEFESDWVASTTYQPGDIVRYGGNQYVAKTNHSATTSPSTDTTNWYLFSEGFNYAGEWAISTSYKIGDVVTVGGYSYVAVQDSAPSTITVTSSDTLTNRFTTSSTSTLTANKLIRFTGSTFGNIGNGDNYYVKVINSSTQFTVSIQPGGAEVQPTTASGSMTATSAAHPTNTSYFQVLNKGINWRGTWAEDVKYEVGDAILYGANSYICVKKHKSEQDDGSTIRAEGGGDPLSRPDQDVTGTFWSVLAVGSETAVLTTRGDMVYYGDAGPTRLPVGLEGQVLRVSDDLLPEWVTLGGQDHTYFVAPNGVDLPAPVHGMTWDKPFKTIRYACEQIDKGPKNPNAKHLLEMNRVFIQREVTEWIQYQIDNATVGSIWESFTYDDFKCERDTGYIVDALMHDISHGGNVKTRGCALLYVNAITDEGTGTYDRLAQEADNDIAAFNYMLEVVEAVLNQTAPAVNYQVTNGDNSTTIATQWTDSTLAAEAGVMTTITSLVGIITDALAAGTADDIPARYAPTNLVNVATGRYYEVLPIIVPEMTCILGAELRSTTAGPRVGATPREDIPFTISTLERISAVAQDVIQGNSVTPTSGNTTAQSDEWPYSSADEATTLAKLMNAINYNIQFRTSANALDSSADPTGYNSSYLVGYGNARKLLEENKEFLKLEVKAWLDSNYADLKFSRTACLRDVGYIIDALVYDLTYGGNAMSVQAGLAYFEGTGSSLFIDSTELPATLAAMAFLKDRAESVAGNISFTALNSVRSQYRDTAGSAAAVTLVGDNIDDIIEIITTGPSAVGTSVTLADPATTDGVSSTTALINAYSTLNSAVSTIQADTITYINTNYPDLVYDDAKCSRDVGIILKAVGYDFMLNSNFQTLLAGRSYLRATATEVFTLGQKAATRAALEFVRTQAIANVGGDSTAIARINSSMDLIDTILYSGSNEGSPCAIDSRNTDWAILQLERNRDFLIAEADAYMSYTFKSTITASAAATGNLTIGAGYTTWPRNTMVKFSGTVFGGVVAGTTYYIQYVNGSTIRIGETMDSSTAFTLTDASGSMTMELVYNNTLCLRDVDEIITSVKYDLKWPGNYKSLLSSRYYANAVVGSLEEDMFYLRDGTGVRDMTLDGLFGDLLPENAYGTSRVSAGAYCSLDPGWGPADFRTWIRTRSPYIQGVTTFGRAAIGQKIDGALHDGGNDSMVSNDFTQLISDGIGAWVTNNARAELVSVFTYYSHIGYLAENGGRIRGTNGNNSYGDFGSVAEGVDSTETPNTAVVDNRFQFVPTVYQVFTSGSQLLTFEYQNAGIDTTETTWAITGGGISGAVVQDEYRDGGVYQIRLLDLGDDSSGQYGGEGYKTNSNTAQGGTTTSLTLAATDDELSTAYVGMKVYLTGGAGAGQFGIITTYNSGSKIATVVRERDGVAGWDHLVPGTTIALPDASTTYTVEPAISFSAPPDANSALTLPSSGDWLDIAYGNTANTYVDQAGTTSSAGVGATFNVIRNGYKYIVSVNSAGSGYSRLETITIAGTDLGGASPENDLVLTITAINSTTGAIIEVDQDGYGSGGVFVALKDGGTGSAYYNGASWTATNIPISAVAVTHGLLDDGSSDQKISRFVAVGTNAIAWSEDGVTWTAGTIPAGTWVDVAFGNGRFVAVDSASNVTVASLDGEVFDLSGTNSAAGSSVSYGRGVFIATLAGSTDTITTSADGLTWADKTLPATTSWTGVVWGANRFIAIAAANAAYSLDGNTWTSTTIDTGSQPIENIAYGQGVFMVTSQNTAQVSTSTDGLVWALKTAPTVSGGYRAVAFGNPQRTGQFITLASGTTNGAAKVTTGAKAKGRAYVAEEKIYQVTISEPGSGYSSAPTMTITDPNNLYEVPHTVRIGNGVNANPSFTNRGSQYTTSSAEVNTTDGYADNYQPGGYVAVRRITQRPVPGSNVVFGNLPGRTFKLVNVITFLGSNDGAYTAFFQVSPTLEVSEAPDHLEDVTTRIRYSQVRLTGHDFLDIGTGGFEDTNYPTNAPVNEPNPANETVTSNGGRVFFTSTDQDGNFRVGDLFAIEQSTGIATLNADAFNISGLQELNLGNVTLGGGSATVTEFSTDPFFTADSDNVVPTQRAIKAYISAQIGGGGASLNVNSVTAGSVFISSNRITTTTGIAIKMYNTFDFRGGVTGAPLAFNYYFK